MAVLVKGSFAPSVMVEIFLSCSIIITHSTGAPGNRRSCKAYLRDPGIEPGASLPQSGHSQEDPRISFSYSQI
jgi:hypothetical protein